MNETDNVLVVCPSAVEKIFLSRLETNRIRFHFLNCEFLETTPPRLVNSDEDLLTYCRKAIQYAAQNEIKAVFFGFDVANIVASIVCREMALPGPNVETVFQCYHKYYTRKAINSSLHYHLLIFNVDGKNRSTELPVGFPFPAYVKPACFSYGLLGQVTQNREDLLSACRNMISEYAPWWNMLYPVFDKYLNTEKYGEGVLSGVPFVVEEFVQADAVTCDGYVYNGKVKILGIVDTVTDKRGVVDCYMIPSRHGEKIEQIISKTVISGVVPKLGINNSFFSIEFFVMPDDTVQLIEVNCRMSSTFRNLYLKCRGYDLYESALQLAFGKEPSSLDMGKLYPIGARVYLSTYGKGSAGDLLDFTLVDYLIKQEAYSIKLDVTESQSISAKGFHPVPLAEIDIFSITPYEFELCKNYLRNLLLKERRYLPYDVDILLDEDKIQAGEGIIWNIQENKPMWIDYKFQKLMIYSPGEHHTESYTLPVPAYSIAHKKDGEFLLGSPSGLYLWDIESNYTRAIATEYKGTQLSFNDITMDTYGRVYGGTICEDNTGIKQSGALYLIDEKNQVQLLDDSIGYSNGVALSPCGRYLYFQDSVAGRIYAYEIDLDSGTPKSRRVLAQVSFDDGILDGITVDENGRIWSTLWSGGCVFCCDEITGDILHRIFLPAPNITSLTFGGDGKKDLYITTSCQAWPASKEFSTPIFMESSKNSAPLFRIRFSSRP
uniref:Sugar lactone lactonase YvrE n=1 Tax=Candidatus Kentrum sp. TC TaxID=2126339 RepID=A0A450YLT2_9GAMM|nr:MAG: Sugar lactone lactonase YvrE [Candidatus Kentron sp. TC]